MVINARHVTEAQDLLKKADLRLQEATGGLEEPRSHRDWAIYYAIDALEQLAKWAQSVNTDIAERGGAVVDHEVD